MNSNFGTLIGGIILGAVIGGWNVGLQIRQSNLEASVTKSLDDIRAGEAKLVEDLNKFANGVQGEVNKVKGTTSPAPQIPVAPATPAPASQAPAPPAKP